MVARLTLSIAATSLAFELAGVEQLAGAHDVGRRHQTTSARETAAGRSSGEASARALEHQRRSNCATAPMMCKISLPVLPLVDRPSSVV